MSKCITGKIDKINRAEALRYLGYSGGDLQQVEPLLAECEQIVFAAQDCRACYAPYDIFAQGETLDLGFAQTESRALARNLQGCDKIVLFAATLGAGVERELAKWQRLSPAKAAVLQAVSAAAAEEWCEQVDMLIQKEYGKGKPRFSCGYGDLPLTLQRDIFTALGVTKQIGVTLTENCFMLPSKSITAIKGILTK